MRKGIPHSSSGALDIILRERDFLNNKDYILKQKCNIADDPAGFLPLFKQAHKAKLSVFAALVSLLLILVSPALVWDVRVSGCERISADEVESALAEIGLRVGAPWKSIDAGKTELLLLDSSPEIGWVAINRRGSVAYVEIIESSLPNEEGNSSLYSNVVATRDCVVRDISVTSGYAVVEVGDVVRRGEVLISGIPPAGTGGGFCRAEGVVLGECDENFSVEIARETIEKEVGEGAIRGLSVNFLNFSVNIFKIYRNYGTECVIIENNEKCRLFGRYEIPLEIVTEYSMPVTERKVALTDTELVSFASDKMREAILSRTAGAELLRLSTSGGFTSNGYRMITTVTVIESVGKDSSIAVE